MVCVQARAPNHLIEREQREANTNTSTSSAAEHNAVVDVHGAPSAWNVTIYRPRCLRQQPKSGSCVP